MGLLTRIKEYPPQSRAHNSSRKRREKKDGFYWHVFIHWCASIFAHVNEILKFFRTKYHDNCENGLFNGTVFADF